MKGSRYDLRRHSALQKSDPSYRATREKILSSAMQAFEEVGFTEITIDEIAKRCDLDRSSIYYYFESKQEIIGSLMESYYNRIISITERIINNNYDINKSFSILLTDLIYSYGNHYPIKYICTHELISHVLSQNSRWKKKIIKLNERFEKLLETLIESGLNTRDLRSKARAQVLIAMIVGLSNWGDEIIASNSGAPASETAAVVADILLNGLRGRDPHNDEYAM